MASGLTDHEERNKAGHPDVGQATAYLPAGADGRPAGFVRPGLAFAGPGYLVTWPGCLCGDGR
jgi:hypothetical protein